MSSNKPGSIEKPIPASSTPSAPETPSKLQNLERRDCIVGDPEDLVHLDWANEWQP